MVKLVLSDQWWSRSRESAQCNEAEASPYRRCHPFRCGLDACSLWRQHSRPVIVFRIRSGSATVELTLWGTYGAGSNSAQKDALEKEIIPAFEKANPGITIKYVDMPYDGLKQKLTTGAAAGELPDLIRTDLGWNAQFAKLGVLKQLDGNMPNYEALASKVSTRLARHDPVQRPPLRPAPGHEHARAHLQPRCSRQAWRRQGP